MPVQGSRSRGGRRRGLAAPVALALTLGLTPVAATAATASARDIDSACPRDRTPAAGFHDTWGTTFQREIDCVVAYGVASGTSRITYRPSRQVTRDQMATFLANVLVASGRSRPTDLPNAFRDDDRSAHRHNIDWLAAEGVVGGFPDGTYRPSQPVTRAQMATFLSNVIREASGSRPTSSTDAFSDDDGNVHEANIDGLAAHGIVTGTGADRYDPLGLVIRGQMAGFLARTIDHLVDAGVVAIPFGPERITVSPSSSVSLQASDNTSGETADTGRREYTVDVPLDTERVSIALMPASQVSVGTDGTPRFTSNAVLPTNGGVAIEVVDGSTRDVANGSADLTHLQDVVVGDDGTVRFTIDGTVMASVLPVVYADTVDPSQDRLDLEAGASTSTPKPAIEAVGVGGVTTWGPSEPAIGTDLSTATVRDVDTSAGWYTLDTGGSSAPEWLIRYANSDTFSYTASNEPVANSPGPITRSQFDSWISVGDRVDPGKYEPGKTTHRIVGDIAGVPTNVVATVQPDGKVKVTFTKPTNPVADDTAASFRLERAAVTNGIVGTFAEVSARAGNLAAEFTDAPTSTGTFAYRVIARSVTGNSPASAVVQAVVSAPAPATTSSAVTHNTGDLLLIDNGDRIQLTFDRAVTVVGGWQVTLLDRDGTQGRLHSGNATPVVSGTAGNTLTIHVGSAGPQILAAGGTPGVSAAPGTSNAATTGFLQVIAAAGIGNATGGWNLPKSGLGSPYNNSRTITDGTHSSSVQTPPAPAGHLVATAAGSVLEAGRDEVQAISVATNADGGTWTISFGGQTTAPLDADANAAAIQSALVALSTIQAGGVTVTGGPITSTAVTVRFTGPRSATDVPTMTVDPEELTTSGAGSVTAPDVSTVIPGAAVTGVTPGDRVTVYSTAGTLLGQAVAAANGRTTVNLSPAVAAGQTLYVVVEQTGTDRRSRTASVVVG